MRAQTATEYLIITAVVIIIAILVITILGGIPGIGSNSKTNTNTAQLRTASIGTDGFFIGNANSTFILQNNQAENIQITAVWVDGVSCDSSSLPFNLKTGSDKTIYCTNINSSDERFNLDYVITYSDIKLGGSYNVTLPKLIGDTVVQASANISGITISSTYWTNITDPTALSDYGQAVAVDSSENFIISGYCSGCGTQGGSAFYTMKFNGSGTHQWTNITDPTSGDDVAWGVAVDGSSDIYVTGYCSGCGNTGNRAIYTVKFDSSGTHQWTNITDPTSGNDIGYGIATDSSDNVYVTGYCAGCGPVGSAAIYTMKFNSGGSLQWTNITDPTANSDIGYDVTTDGSSNVIVTGSCDGCGVLGGSAIYTIKLNSAGTHQWTNITDPTASYDYGRGVAVDGSDNVYVTGHCDGCGSAGGIAMHTSKFDSAGTHQWTNITDPTSSYDYGRGVAVDSSDNVYVSGYCDGCGATGGVAMYTFKLNSGGTHQWTNITDPSTDWDGSYGVAVDSGDNVYVGGLCFTCGSLGSYAIYSFKLNSSDGLQN